MRQTYEKILRDRDSQKLRLQPTPNAILSTSPSNQYQTYPEAAVCSLSLDAKDFRVVHLHISDRI